MAISYIDWPSELPQQPLIDGFNEEPSSIKIRTEMDAAIAKQRPRFSTSAESRTFKMLMTNAQYQTFKTFYKDTLRSGSLEFNMQKPGIPGENIVVRFNERSYSPSPIGIHWMVQLNLEEIP